MWILIGVTAALLVCDRVLKALALQRKAAVSRKAPAADASGEPGLLSGQGQPLSRTPAVGTAGDLAIGGGAAAARCGAADGAGTAGHPADSYRRTEQPVRPAAAGQRHGLRPIPGAGKKLRNLVWNLADFMLLGGTVLTAIGLLRELIKGK